MRLKVWFTDFWFPSTVEQIRESDLYLLLSKRFSLELDAKHPDVLFYGSKRYNFQRYRCLRIAITYLEPYVPRLMECDFSISVLSEIPGRNYYFPTFMFGDVAKDLLSLSEQKSSRFESKQEFCNFVYNNKKCVERNTFFKLLSHYKFVHAPGRVFRNTQGLISRRDKDFMAAAISYKGRFKFTIAFENRSLKNYVSEKIVHAFQCRSLPIYWGAPNISDYFNTKAFINCHDYPDFETVIRHIREVDENEELYRSYMEAPVCTSSSYINSHMDHDEKMLDALEAFLRHPPRRVNAASCSYFSRSYSYMPRQLLNKRRMRQREMRPKYGTDMDDIQAYIISIPDNKGKCEHLQDRLELQGMRCEVFAGTDAETDNLEIYDHRLRPQRMTQMRGYPMTKKEIACYLSHYQLYTHICAQDKEFAVILEEDARIDDNFYNVVRTLPYIDWEWDVVRLSAHNPNGMGKELCHITGNHFLHRLRKPLSDSVATLVSKKALKRLIEKLWLIEMPLDTACERWWETDLRYLCVFPFVAAQEIDHDDAAYIKRKRARTSLSISKKLQRRYSLWQDAWHRQLWAIINQHHSRR
jgi:GR25 family glycosyltransferase involved in LPS biosynthesis